MKNTIYTNTKNDQKTAEWLKKQGITNKQFETKEIWQLQASKAAQDVIKNHFDNLSVTDEDFVRDFCCAITSDHSLKFITQKRAYRMLNLYKRIKRNKYQIFKKLKKSTRSNIPKRQAPTNT
jgi:hypothetical protein